MQIDSKNDWNVFLFFMKFLIITKHCDYIWLGKTFEQCENFHITNGFFQGQWP